MEPVSMRMWPSLSISLPMANKIADAANWFLIGSLIVGVVSTFTIVLMSGIKEGYWEADRRASAEKIAGLTTQSDQLRKETAEANARAAEAQLELEKLKTPRTLGPTRQEVVANSLRRFAGQRYRAAISQGADDGWRFGNRFTQRLNAPVGYTSRQDRHPLGTRLPAFRLHRSPELKFDSIRKRNKNSHLLRLPWAMHSTPMGRSWPLTGIDKAAPMKGTGTSS
jgi:hypothetical protein